MVRLRFSDGNVTEFLDANQVSYGHGHIVVAQVQTGKPRHIVAMVSVKEMPVIEEGPEALAF